MNYSLNSGTSSQQLLKQWMITISLLLPLTYYIVYYYFHGTILFNLHYEEVNSKSTIILSLLISIYRSLITINLLLFLTFLNIKVWDRFSIGYKSIFKLNEYYYNSFDLVLSTLSAVVFFVFLVLITLSQKLLNWSDQYKGNLQMRLKTTTWIWILCISVILYNKAIRKVIGMSILDMIRIPIQSVSFLSFWVADQMCSLSLFIKDLNYVLCFTASLFTVGGASLTSCHDQMHTLTPMFFSTPLLLRMAQCLRVYYDTRHLSHLFNMLKYFISLITVLIPHHKPIWIPLATISTLYSFYWDIVKDWGLGNPKSINPFLRDTLIFHDKNFYYFSIVSNLIMRFGWTVPILLQKSGNEFNHDILYIYLLIMEVFRRNQWNFIRLEYEVITRNKTVI
ncbi:hypothetical protein DLAC_04739 [Tieghemostelium lacteum]|uniref:EXS domain-containing protein n=1 Tax=Tieghemostelium lacteum TaxID=361077 RepID=A0A151ZKC0_TIELA|nr:hypothetical protein DLAC_04739 [Tieghemostelium lacteum]|eukprot:KYQ94442.1 hypothetical protein DLAC_04739 [Tieghemostelium lacteum]